MRKAPPRKASHLIGHFHGIDGYRRDLLERMALAYRRLFSLASAIVSPSRQMNEQLIRLGASAEKVLQCTCGVDVPFFSGARPEDAPPVLIAAGRFVEKKAPHLTIMAFRRLIEQAPEARLVMIGEGPMLDACRELAKTFKISDRMEFRGICTPAEIAASFKRARAFVQHSLQAPDGDSESSPVAIKEAGAAGLPVISTCHAGIPDIVAHGETGYLVPERDIEGMASYVMRLIMEPALAGTMGRAATQRIEAYFSMDICINSLWQVIRRALL